MDSFANEKFLKVKGVILDEETKEPLSNYIVKVVQDQLDSNLIVFNKSKFQVWLPANRKSRVYFIKKGYVVKHIYVDASFIPSIAYKKKQEIDITIEMTKTGVSKLDFSKPIMIATYAAKDNAFTIEDSELLNVKKATNKLYKPPFPAPVDTYKNVKPTTNTLALTEKYNKKKAETGELSKVIQGILFADMNYCLFNERTNQANNFLVQLKEISNSIWGNIKPFDSPEYGKIVVRTINREESIDTLFALGAYVETSRLIFENFTSDSKVLVHLKVLKKVLRNYQGTGISSEQEDFVNQMRQLIPIISDLENKYTKSLRDKMNFEMVDDELFLSIKSQNQSIYENLIE